MVGTLRIAHSPTEPLADSGAGVILRGVAVTESQTAVRPGELASGEVVLWRERRTPPFMEFTIAVVAVLAVGGVAAQNVVFTPLALVAAVAAAVLGRRFAAGHYLEDQLLTDRRVVVVPRIGAAYGLAARRHPERRVARHEGRVHRRRRASCASASCAGTGRSARRSRRARRTSRSSSAGTRTAPVEACAGSRAVCADGDRSADGGVLPARRRERCRPAPVRRRRTLRLGDGAAGRCRSRRRQRERRLRGLRAQARRQGPRHDPRQRRAATACPRRPGALRCSRCSTRCAIAATSCSWTRAAPAAPGASARRRDAYGAGASAGDLDAVRAALGIGHVELYGAGDGARIALAYAARHGDRLRALVLDGGPRATLFSGDGHGEAHALARALGHGETAVAELAARLRTHPLHAHGRIDDDVLARVAANGDAAALGDLPAASTAALRGDPLPLARLVGRHGACRCAPGRPGPGELLPRRRRARRERAGGRRAVHRGDLAARARARRLQGLAAAGRARPRAAARHAPLRRAGARARRRGRRARADGDSAQGRIAVPAGEVRPRPRRRRAAGAQRSGRLRGHARARIPEDAAGT